MKALSDGFDVFTNIINDGINYDSFDARNVAALAASLNSAYKHGLINQEDLESALIKYYDEIDRVNEPISLNQDQYNEVVDVLSKFTISFNNSISSSWGTSNSLGSVFS